MLINCKICKANTAGFCFGVDRAIKIVYNNLDKHGDVVTLGPIIHNQNVVDDLEAKGVYSVDKISDLKDGQTVIIRSHGIPLCDMEALKKMDVKIVNATCPFVERIQKIAYEKSTEGSIIVIAGDLNHPEVIGIKGYCINKSYVFSTLEELSSLLEKLKCEENVVFLSQTTYNKGLWDKSKELIKNSLSNAQIYDTICNATASRQEEAIEIAKNVDIMLIIGGKHSSNTIKLKNVCEEYCKTYHIETARDLNNINFSKVHKIGISAGASTPAYIIEEVEQTMSEIQNNNEADFNFEEALEASFKKIYIGAKVTGYITAVNKSEVLVDIGSKHTGVIPASELSDDQTKSPEELVKVGDEIEVIVLKTNDQEGVDTLSKKRVDAMVGFEKLVTAKEEDTILTGVVTNVVKGGVLVSVNGTRVFIPASQSGTRRDENLETLLKKEVEFKLIDIDMKRQRAVGSIKVISNEKRNKAKTEFFETAESGKVVTGKVKSITDYGVFVDLGSIDGLIRKPDLSWKRFGHPSDVVSVGDEIEVRIKDVDKENGKVSLILKKDEDNPWAIFEKNYGVGQTVKVKIVSITSFGAFAQIVEGVDGLIHISQIANQRVDNVASILEVGQEVDAKIIDINDEKKRISLSMRALLPVEEPEAEAEEAADSDEEKSDVVYSTENPDDFASEEKETEAE